MNEPKKPTSDAIAEANAKNVRLQTIVNQALMEFVTRIQQEAGEPVVMTMVAVHWMNDRTCGYAGPTNVPVAIVMRCLGNLGVAVRNHIDQIKLKINTRMVEADAKKRGLQ